MPLYGDVESGDYGDSLYGEEVGAIKSVRNRVGTDFDIAINGVGLKLVPDKKAYDKKAAQTFSYNPKSLFKSGDGAALVAKDLYYWSRLEHSRWDGGETYNPWQPGETSDPNRRDTHYASSYGFDTSDPFKLTHLREVRVSPSYEFAITNDSPIAYWILGDHPSSAEAYDQIASDRTPGTPYGATTFGIAPSPIVNDPNTVALFDGITGDIRTVKKVPFSGNVTPNAGPWSLEAWVAPAVLPQKSIIAAVGHEVIAGGSYKDLVISETPAAFWPLDDAGPIIAVEAMQDGSHDTGGYNAVAIENYPADPTFVTFNNAGPSAGMKSVLFPGRGGAHVGAYLHTNILFDGGPTPHVPGGQYGFNAGNGVDWTAELWFYPTSVDQGCTLIGNYTENHNPNWGLTVHGLWVEGVENEWNRTGLLLNFAGYHTIDSSNSGSYAFPAINTWYHIVFRHHASNLCEVYSNGVLVASRTIVIPGATGVNQETFQIGGDASVNYPYVDGRMSSVAMYDYLLSDAQITNHYGVGNPSGAAGGFAMGIASADGTTTGSRLVVRLPGVDWFDGGYTFGKEIKVDDWKHWWSVTPRGGHPIDEFDTYVTIPEAGVWHHIVMTSSGTNVKTYVDGVLKATLAQAATSIASYASIGAMRQMDTSFLDIGDEWFLNGQVCQVAVYNAELSGAQVTNHFNAGSGASSSTLLTAAQDYARFVETYDGKLYINQKNTKINYSSDGGVSWATVTLPDSDVTTINAVWSKGDKVYVATATNVYLGTSASFAKINTGGNPAVASVTAGLYYSGQLYVGIGTSLYYVDPATGAKTQLYDTGAFSITFIEAFGGKIWFGGSAGRQTKVWTWTNSTLPPSPANGIGAQLQDGTIPYGFVVQSSIVYLNTLLLGGLIAGDTTTEGQGAVYYIEPGGSFGQLCVLGPLLSTLRGSGIDYGVRSLWGAEDKLWMGFNNLTGIGVYNFVTGSFSTHSRTTKYTTATVNAVARVRGHNLFTIKDDGNCWREADSRVGVAMIEESEFQELPFIPKIIDGIEGMHSALDTGEQIEIQISYDKGASWQSLGTNVYEGTTTIDIPVVNTLANHWRTRLLSYRGGNALLAPEIYSHSVRFAPRNSFKHEWIVEATLPIKKRTSTGFLITDPGSKLLQELWQAYEDGVAVEYIDRDRKVYKCMVLFFEETRDRFEPARAQGNQLNLSPSFHVELLEVEKVS